MLISLPKETIDRIFFNNKPMHGIVKLYKAVAPGYSSLKEVTHYPRVNRKTAEYIVGQIRRSTRIHGKGKGFGSTMLTWANIGFDSAGKDIPEWCVEVDE